MTADAAKSARRKSSLVTGRAEWKPLLAAAESEGFDLRGVVILKDIDPGKTWAAGEPYDADVEIRDARTWEMDEPARSAIEARLRAAVEPARNGPGLRFVWRPPVRVEWATAFLDARDKLWRDAGRGRITSEAYSSAFDAIGRLHKRVWDDGEDDPALMAQIDEAVAEARRHPELAKEIPPLPEGRVDVAETMAVLRRIADGSTMPAMEDEHAKWSSYYHVAAVFLVDGWRFEAFKRNDGMKYVQSCTAPDGRTGGFDFFETREGDPFMLLEDDEQDRICDILDAMGQPAPSPPAR